MQGILGRLLGNTPAFPPLPAPWSEQELVYADVGARGGPPSNWLRLTNQIDYICFEPDPVEAESLKRFFASRKEFKGLVITTALGSHKGSVNLNLTRLPAASSVLQPNHNLLRDFEIGSLLEVERQIEVAIDTLDSQLQSVSKSCDFLKIDAQGYELEILHGAGRALLHTRGCELEVSFIEIYQNQPLFADIDSYMRSQGFFLADLERIWWRHHGVPDYVQLRGSIAYANALYLANSISDPIDKEQLLKGTIVCIAAGLYEMAHHCVKNGSARGLISQVEERAFDRWMCTYCRSIAFWNRLSHLVSRLPGHQTLSRWLGLWSRSLQGSGPVAADSLSWLRRNSW
jgi:FkbM family methyltransferase